ncbi:MAG: HAMP domain-containing histidine kinase [Candidatus Hydrogenedentes bacterium]|nr:HAMP domain-containing histidine kinase [Candidatus Hydrogenedentota bacterium]
MSEPETQTQPSVGKLSKAVTKIENRLAASGELHRLVYDPEALFQKALTYALEWVPAERAFLLSHPAPGQKAKVLSSVFRRGDPNGPAIDQTVVEFVQEKRNAMLKMLDASNTQNTGGLPPGAMCAPLIGQNGCVGAMYVDSAWDASPFDTHMLDALKALGRLAGLAVENAQRNRVLSEQARRLGAQEAAGAFGADVSKVLASIDAATYQIEAELKNGDIEKALWLWPLLERTFSNAEMLVENMQAYARRRALVLTTVNIDELIDKTLASLAPRAERLNITTTFEPRKNATAYTDSRDTFLVLMNVLSYAIDAYERKEGVVSISATNENKFCMVSVAHKGAVMTGHQIRELLAGTLPTNIDLDMRLVTSLKVVRELGGEIRIQSDPTSGTRISLILPQFAPEDAGS